MTAEEAAAAITRLTAERDATRKTNAELHRRIQAEESKQVRALRDERDALLETIAELKKVPSCDLPHGPKGVRPGRVWERLDALKQRKWNCAVIYPEEAAEILAGRPRREDFIY